MILAVDEDQTVRVIVPADTGREMCRRTEIRAVLDLVHCRETVAFAMRDHIAFVVGQDQLAVTETGDVGIGIKPRIFKIERGIKVVDQRAVFGQQAIMLFRKRIVDRGH